MKYDWRKRTSVDVQKHTAIHRTAMADTAISERIQKAYIHSNLAMERSVRVSVAHERASARLLKIERRSAETHSTFSADNAGCK